MHEVDTRRLDQLAERLALTLPPGLKALRGELAENFRVVLQNNLEKLDLVSRDTFDTQAALLRRTSQRLRKLEERIAELETQLRAKGG